MRDINRLSREMPWPKTGATHYHARLGLLDKGWAVKGLVVCYVLWLGWLSCSSTETPYIET